MELLGEHVVKRIPAPPRKERGTSQHEAVLRIFAPAQFPYCLAIVQKM
jgi:hypothetical protein